MKNNLDKIRKNKGFPIGKDDDLQMLSDPLSYTLYPNPYIQAFIEKYGERYTESHDSYFREPFISDVSEGKNDSIYNAHTYHTKVPYKAIIPFINHYTETGAIVFDGFCGTGMTGVAAQAIDRKAVLVDLSPAATFIAYNYNTPLDPDVFDNDFDKILNEVNSDCGWMYETEHLDGRKGIINFTVWSDVFICPYCKRDLIFWEIAVSKNNKVLEEFSCSHCQAKLSKRELTRKFQSVYDSDLGANRDEIVQVPVWINYSVGNKRFEKKVDEADLKLIKVINESQIPYWYPVDRMPIGDESRRNDSSGITHVHQFYTRRNLWTLACLASKVRDLKPRYLIAVLSIGAGLVTKLTRYNLGNRGNGPVSGTLYMPSLIAETSVFKVLPNKLRDLRRMGDYAKYDSVRIGTGSTSDLTTIPSDSIDYIFTDPPFGSNLMYSELNFIWEAWLKVFTNNVTEAIINNSQKKDLKDYRDLMTDCFVEMNRILKPGRWITVEFHNSKASVWNAIQDSLMRAGFVVAQVTVLDKQQGSFKQVTSAGAVKNDLVINAYKPRAGFTQRLISEAGHGLETDFVREHLRQLSIAANAERSKEMLYSKYLAYYVQHGYQIAYNGEQFYRALLQWGFEERDGYWFADEAQAQEYEQRKVKTFGKKGVQPQAVLFISDERSARQWIWNFLDEPKTYDEIYTKFVPALQTSEDEIPELTIMLEESFVRTNGHWKRPDQLTQAELEQKRLERLLRQFNEYLEAAQAGQKVKEVRREAVLAGFTECYRDGRFQDIITLGSKLDKRLLEESPDLFDFIDIAKAKVES